MFNPIITKVIYRIVSADTIRECVYCAYETVAERCPKCMSHSFTVYRQKRKVA